MDVFRAGQVVEEEQGTFHSFGMEIHPQAIDWMLASGHFSVVHTKVDRYHRNSLFPSDHYPILTTLDWADSS